MTNKIVSYNFKKIENEMYLSLIFLIKDIFDICEVDPLKRDLRIKPESILTNNL